MSQQQKTRNPRKNALAESAKIAPLEKITFDFPADKSDDLVISRSQIPPVGCQILRGMGNLHYKLFTLVWNSNDLPLGDFSSLARIACDAESRKADIEAASLGILNVSFDDVLSPEKDKEIAQIFRDVTTLAAANALRSLTSLEAEDYEGCIAYYTNALTLTQLVNEACRRFDIFCYTGHRISFAALGSSGAKKRHAPTAKLRAWALEKYRAGKWRSANQAAHALKPAILAYGRSINAHLSEENAQRTIADWFRKSV